ncbi:hypothetical protein D3C72_1789750 [compost metagenome]
MKAQRWIPGAQRDGAIDPHDHAQGALRVIDLRHRRPAQDQVRRAGEAARQLVQRGRLRAAHAVQIAADQPVAAIPAHLHEWPQRLVVPQRPGPGVAIQIAQRLGHGARAQQAGNERKTMHIQLRGYRGKA